MVFVVLSSKLNVAQSHQFTSSFLILSFVLKLFFWGFILSFLSMSLQVIVAKTGYNHWMELFPPW